MPDTAAFYSLSPAEQADRLGALARRAATAWEIGEVDTVSLLKHRENAVFRIEAGGGQCYAMRVHRAGYHNDDELRSELAWMRALDAYGIRTPSVVLTRDGRPFDRVAIACVPETRQVDLFDWVDGRPLADLEAATDEPEIAGLDVYRAIGSLAARVHNQSAAWTPPPGFTRHAWDIDGLVGAEPFWGRFWELEALSTTQRELVLRARSAVHEALATFRQHEDRYGLIHADLLPDNVIVCGETTRLLDFDDAGFGWHLFDLATPLAVHLDDQSRTDAIADALVAGYRSERDLPESHLKMLPVFIMARLLTYVGWAHTRRETETAQLLTPLLVAGACGFAESFLSRTA